ncbi:MAG TPA: DUF1707 domain-containing protein [Streptosporangiaceae bacterium]|nr:DUF1707 domain-containing protein [Streptosporangiaceae bacterium]
MSEPSKPAGTPAPKPHPRAAYGNPGMRISDAERAEVSDRLSQHYSDGRLDEAEFGKRLDQAMHAVTQSDLDGLFDDLPDGAAGRGGPADGGRTSPGRASRRPAGPERPAADGRRRTPASRVVSVAVLVVLAVIIAQALSHMFIPWILIAVVAFVWLRRRPRRHRHSSPESTPEA